MFERVETRRLVLRKPERSDANAIFSRYANDLEVTRLLAWPRHHSLDATHQFLDFSEAEWSRSPVGPYLVESRQDGALLGGSGLAFETATCAATGYVFAKDAWGKGYATESLRAVVDIAREAGAGRVYALCHPENIASQRVLSKCGFVCEGILRQHCKFPNLSDHALFDVLSFGLDLLSFIPAGERASDRCAPRVPPEEHALELLHSEEQWRDSTRDQIERGWGQLERGELLTAEESQLDMEQRKAAWLASRKH